MKTYLAAILTASLVALGGCESDSPTPAPAPDTPITAGLGDKVQLSVGGELVITLESNPTTGYFWQYTLTGDTAPLAEAAADYVADPAPEGVVGSGGRQVFRFSAEAPGTAQLTFSYERGPDDVFETGKVRVTVSDGS